MTWPWSLIASLIVLGVGVALLVVGVLAPGAEPLIDPGTYCLTAAIGGLVGRGADAIQAAVRPPVPVRRSALQLQGRPAGPRLGLCSRRRRSCFRASTSSSR
jgi:hypothetical protein